VWRGAGVVWCVAMGADVETGGRREEEEED
jgi:hypothetical protein